LDSSSSCHKFFLYESLVAPTTIFLRTMIRNNQRRNPNSRFVPRNRPQNRNARLANPITDVKSLETKLVNGPSDPRTTLSDTVFTKVFTTTVTLAGGAANLGSSQIGALISSNNTALLSYRIQKVSVFASATDSAFVGVQLALSDEASYRDYGTAGSLRPQVHLRPSLEFRQTWRDIPGSNVNLLALSGGTTDVLIVQLTLEVRVPLPFT